MLLLVLSLWRGIDNSRDADQEYRGGEARDVKSEREEDKRKRGERLLPLKERRRRKLASTERQIHLKPSRYLLLRRPTCMSRVSRMCAHTFRPCITTTRPPRTYERARACVWSYTWWTRTQSYRRRSNNGTVTRLPFFRDNQ